MGVLTFTDPNLEATTIITSGITQPFEGAGLRPLYLAERVCWQLVGEDALQILMDPLVFKLAPLSVTNAEYQLWRNGIPYAQRVTNK